MKVIMNYVMDTQFKLQYKAVAGFKLNEALFSCLRQLLIESIV